LFSFFELKYLDSVEDWKLDWCHYYDLMNIGIIISAIQVEIKTAVATDLDFNNAHNIIFFRLNYERFRRKLRIVKMEGCSHPLKCIPFRITNKGIQIIEE